MNDQCFMFSLFLHKDYLDVDLHMHIVYSCLFSLPNDISANDVKGTLDNYTHLSTLQLWYRREIDTTNRVRKLCAHIQWEFLQWHPKLAQHVIFVWGQ